LLPDSVNVPVPILLSPPVPEMTPAKLVEVPSAPVVSTPEPSDTPPAPASEPIVSLKPARSRPASAPIVKGDIGARLLAEPAFSVPPETSVAPV
jgi:hypothetical protein